MASAFNVGGMITGLDSNAIIRQLMQIERQPLTRLEARVSTLEKQRDAVRALRTQLLSLRNAAQNFRLGTVFGQYEGKSSNEKVLGVSISSQSPVIGAYEIEVQQLASATVANSGSRMGAAINPDAALNSSGINTDISAGTFSINGVSFAVDPATQTLNEILGQINSSSAGVTATYDAATDRVHMVNSAAGNTNLINLGASDDTSNFLTVAGVKTATQGTDGGGSTEVWSARNLGAVEPGAKISDYSFGGGAMTAGTFFVNGVSISVDPTADSLSDVLQRITDSDAQVSASYDSATDTIKLVSKTTGSRTIGLIEGTSNFLAVTNLATAVQTAGKDAQFTVNGGPVQTRNSNEVADAIGGLTLRFLSTGTSTITVSGDDDSIVEDVQGFIKSFNETVDKIAELSGQQGDLRNDGSIRGIEIEVRDIMFSVVSGITGDYTSLLDIGISTGNSFDVSGIQHLTLDENKFREMLRSDRLNVKDLFSNTGGTGIGDKLFELLETTTRSTGFLNDRSKSNGSIDQQVRAIKDQMERLQERVSKKEQRLRSQFAQLEQLSANFQSQNSTLSIISRL